MTIFVLRTVGYCLCGAAFTHAAMNGQVDLAMATAAAWCSLLAGHIDRSPA